MSEIEFPEGQYLSISGRIHPGSGGQTKALLMRNRLFAQHSTAEPVLLALDDSPKYPKMREALYESGQLPRGMPLFNVFEWYRDNTVDHLPPSGDVLPVVRGLEKVSIRHPDGTVYKTQYAKRSSDNVALLDYHRADGSVFLRVPAGEPNERSTITDVYLINSNGEPVGRWPTQQGWRRQWVLNFLEPNRRTFLFCDSRYAIANIMPMRDERLHIIHLVHNVHVRSPYSWSSAITSTYRPLFTFVPQLDALVTLTSRQGEDLAARFGATENLFVVPNPVETPPPPSPLPARDPKGFVILARLEFQKRLEDAIRAFALVVKEEPDATLDIYGDGTLHPFLAGEIKNHGVQESVRLRGFDPQARKALWTATGMLMTSRFEGYPLASLEAMSQGCPVISYDVKYGLREQITDGVNGFLAEAGDVQAIADHVVRMIRNPDMAAELSRGAFEHAERHDYRAFLEDWRSVLEQVVEMREHRTTIQSVNLKVTRLGFRRARRLPDSLAKGALLRRLNGRRTSSAGFTTARPVEFAARLKLTGRSNKATLDDVIITLEAVDEEAGSINAVPLEVRRVNEHFMLSSTLDPAQIFLDGTANPASAVRLRLRLVWHNSSWQTWLGRPRKLAPNFELSYSGSGELTLLRGPQVGR